MRDMKPGDMITTKFENEYVRLWHTTPRELSGAPKNEEEDRKLTDVMRNSMGPMWPRGSFATLLERDGSWLRVMTPAGPGWIGEWNVEVLT